MREPARADYRGRRVLTNPPPSAGGILLVLAFDRLEARSGAGGPDAATLAAVMEEVQALRTPEFVAGLDEPGFLERFLGSSSSARRRTSRCSTATAAPAR